jgi:4-hydroxybenzoate polyprenyltransferase
MKGDSRFGCKTLAVIAGESKTKNVAYILALIGLSGTIWLQTIFFEIEFWILFGYFFALDALFVTVLYSTYKLKDASGYGKLSSLIKVLMVVGILSMLLFYLET